MSDPSPGQPTGVRQTPIRIDERGRRVRDDGVPEPFPPALKAGDAAEGGVSSLAAQLAAYIAKNDARFVTGPGFSSNLGQGLRWNPNAAGAQGAGGGDGLGILDNIIIVFNGTAEYCELSGTVTGPV